MPKMQNSHISIRENIFNPCIEIKLILCVLWKQVKYGGINWYPFLQLQKSIFQSIHCVLWPVLHMSLQWEFRFTYPFYLPSGFISKDVPNTNLWAYIRLQNHTKLFEEKRLLPYWRIMCYCIIQKQHYIFKHTDTLSLVITMYSKIFFWRAIVCYF